MKRSIVFILMPALIGSAAAQNVGVNTDGSVPEAGVMMDVKGTNSFSVTATQTALQLKSFDASGTALKLRLILGTNAAAGSRYGAIDVYDASAPAYRHLSLQPAGGFVGIGTTVPNTQLDVAGNSTGGIRILGPSTGVTNGMLQISDNDGGAAVAWPGGGHIVIWPSGTGLGILRFQKSSVSAWNFVDRSTVNTAVGRIFAIHDANGAGDCMTFLGNGNVGIGSTAPGNRLVVSSSTALDGIYQTDGTRWLKYMSGTTGAGSYNNLTLANDNAIIFSGGAIGTGALVIGPWISATAAGIRIDNTGKVGIGISSPAEELHVSGDIRASSLAGTGSALVQADVNGTLSRSAISGLIPPLVAIDIAHNFDPTVPTNNNNHIGIMASYVPSTGKVWVISTNYTTNTENMDIPSGTPGNEWNPDGGNNMVWMDFGDPNGVGTAYVISLDVAVSTFVTASDECSAVITVRMSNGDLYIRSTTPNNLISGAALDVVANWGAWQILVDPGE